MSNKDIELEDLGDYEMDDHTSAKVEKMITEADAELEEARVNFRWGKKQVKLVKEAAELIGIPYQIYIKETVYRQALKDLREARTSNAEDLIEALSLVAAQEHGLRAIVKNRTPDEVRTELGIKVSKKTGKQQNSDAKQTRSSDD